MVQFQAQAAVVFGLPQFLIGRISEKYYIFVEKSGLVVYNAHARMCILRRGIYV
jgi:hypothetical protein